MPLSTAAFQNYRLLMLSLASPAKINLFLRIISRRTDGYHDLASLFQTIDLTDTIDFALQDKDELFCNDPTIPIDSSNLIIKAADLFRRKTGLKFGLKVRLHKKIPHQAGLGGGSSNAATTLWAFNQLTGHPATLEELKLWSSEIGSDIPFFLSGGTAYCTGRGEMMRELSPLPSRKMWIVKPKQGLSTPAIYKHLDLNKLIKRDPIDHLQRFIAGDWQCFNDLEQPAFDLMPDLVLIKKALLDSGFNTVLMTGSGSAFFCLGEASPPSLPNTTTYSVNFCHRAANTWY